MTLLQCHKIYFQWRDMWKWDLWVHRTFRWCTSFSVHWKIVFTFLFFLKILFHYVNWMFSVLNAFLRCFCLWLCGCFCINVHLCVLYRLCNVKKYTFFLLTLINQRMRITKHMLLPVVVYYTHHHVPKAGFFIIIISI